MKPILEFINNNVSKGAEILDLGCAQGNFTLALAELGFKVLGVDLKPSFIEYAKQKQQSGSSMQKTLASFRVQNAMETSFANQFDVILFLEIVEHLDNPSKVVKSVLRHLRAGGIFILSTVNKGRMTSKAPSYTEFKSGKGRNQFSNSFRGSEHVYEFTKDELLGFLKEIGLEVLHIYPTANLMIYPLANLLSFDILQRFDKVACLPLSTFGYVIISRIR